MSRITRFEDLVAWQKARALAAAIGRVSAGANFSRDYSLRNQIRSAANSVPANIAEGFERYRLREFHQFLSIAKASCAEVRSHLYVAFDLEYISEELLRRLMNQAEEVGRIVGKLRAAIQHQLQLRTQNSGLRTPRRANST